LRCADSRRGSLNEQRTEEFFVAPGKPFTPRGKLFAPEGKPAIALEECANEKVGDRTKLRAIRSEHNSSGNGESGPSRKTVGSPESGSAGSAG
jgi:hypothetical protein